MSDLLLDLILRPGMVVVEAGSGRGGVTTAIAARVESTGRVYGFEPVAALAAQAARLWKERGVADRIRMRECLLGEKTAQSVDFYIAPEPYAPTSTRNPDILHFHPTSVREALPMAALDDLALEDLEIRPDVLYLDMEGGEYQALRGARRMVEGLMPEVIVHTHGLETDGIGGSVLEIAQCLESAGYRLFDWEEGFLISARQFGAKYRTRIGWLLASQRLREAEFLARLTAEHRMATR